MSAKNSDKKELIKHISRLEGQLSAVKKELQKENTDCLKASTTLFASSRSFASLRHAFIKCFLEKDFLNAKNTKGESDEYLSLLNLIKG